jgi:hypothetical protein
MRSVSHHCIHFSLYNRLLGYIGLAMNHRLSINRPTKRGKEMSPSYGHRQCEKEMDDHLLACQQIFEREPHSDTPC